MSDPTRNGQELRYELVAEPLVAERSADPLLVLKRTLRGRYRLAAILAVGLALIGVAGGYFATPPTYESAGVVHVRPALPTVLYESKASPVGGEYESFIAMQANLLKSREILEQVASDPALRTLGFEPDPEAAIRALEAAVSIERPRGEPYITVRATSNDPAIAQAIVQSLLRTFDSEARHQQTLSPQQIEDILTQRQMELESELQQMRESLLRVTDQYGVEALEQLHRHKVDELVLIDQRLAELDLAVAAQEEGVSYTGAAQFAVAGQAEPAAMLAELRDQERALVSELERWQDRYGPQHSMIRELNRQLQAVEVQIAMLTDPSGAALTPTTDRFIELKQTYAAIRQDLAQEAAALGQKRSAMTGLTEHIDEIKQRLSLTRNRLDQLRLEHSHPNASRVQITSTGDLPLMPTVDRRTGLAAAGGLFGLLAGLACTVMIGLVDPRLRYVAEMRESLPMSPLLATLPDLTDAPRELHERSALGVHQVRNLLESRFVRHGANVLAISSVGRGEGKTSLALAMGSAFAGGGRSVLLIDADGRADLSHELGLLSQPGAAGAGASGAAEIEVQRTRTENLWVLPAGAIAGFDPRCASCDRLQHVLDAVRAQFDVVLIDTGSMMTSIEGPLVAAMADAVVLTVARHQRVHVTRAAVERLDMAGGRCAGIVFNRAVAGDVEDHCLPARDERRATVALVPNALAAHVDTAGRVGDPAATRCIDTARHTEAA